MRKRRKKKTKMMRRMRRKKVKRMIVNKAMKKKMDLRRKITIRTAPQLISELILKTLPTVNPLWMLGFLLQSNMRSAKQRRKAQTSTVLMVQKPQQCQQH